MPANHRGRVRHVRTCSVCMASGWSAAGAIRTAATATFWRSGLGTPPPMTDEEFMRHAKERLAEKIEEATT